ncbi:MULTISPECIES: NAD-dependent epimerase/dehydratase family protein [Brevibacillus]|jgi:UDP-glucuronate 4-epimerase|uniref:NAD-dependent epimerase/dehydratase family protein n=1 Tax=Brevibacillus TaxID=55080 RepID=UPI00156AB29A|nr:MULTISPECIES: NAD-dependent epimerase/dehydratase family protein [Brevibacillus]MDH6351349.1 UDP-glucuronate 4-epimerase [Brevibacillus sp. 1238]MED2254861.1 NAD-dependent epimerase/dehydratase family protein [Brevibacillus parabrevis]UED67645.1 NAD-dependent epimerase/dehydratase family protein [Brevibacillus sp. HD3.3A]WDV93895.1 NAD-dependent epimerase/dehydratase family protein [Brevibacillus parabrevis]
MSILVTGTAGFIGFHVAKRLLEGGEVVWGVDNCNEYYDPRLKAKRLSMLQEFEQFHFYQADIADQTTMDELFRKMQPERVIHLAAQAGVRYSLENPHVYTSSNITGFLHILEGCRHTGVKHLLYASSSSVYGGNKKLPFSEGDRVDEPNSLYAATKKANELMAYTYSHLYNIPATGLRFFTVYGPWGRPDMALYAFTKAILAGEPVSIFNYGKMIRDFTYIDDVVEGILRLMDRLPEPKDGKAPHKVLNIGNHRPVELLSFLELLEQKLKRPANRQYMPIQPGDVAATFASVDALFAETGFRPDTPVEVGISRFVDWYLDYYGDAHA